MARRSPDTMRLLGGVVGPAVFVTAWVALGATTPGYSPTRDPISDLAGVQAATRLPMTAAMVVFALGLAAYATAVGGVLGRGVTRAAAGTAVATLAVAATPLDSPLGGMPHGLAAGLAYACFTALPLLAAAPLRRSGARRAAAASLATGSAMAVFLVTSTLAGADVGLWQRLGLTLGDVWLVTSALVLLRRSGARQHPLPAGAPVRSREALARR